ncbi:hypothetical protein SAMN05421636_10562 [Pricia antarctica]|uniref:Uncharacterized protein n=1 Tax=Pricia antarctica TaxID=641691 RepID=A0A1G7CWM5_9FLAO|nr:hypothetical protein [Pricia antarctica]SDE43708.1 hypothetical protein SAMN05421636_10562 [Pricia antarctica]
MESLGTVLSEIVQVTTIIETEHRELYKFLDEDPMTLTAAKKSFGS